MDTIFGLPIHPLLVHAPVIAVPTLVIVALCYALIPVAQQRIGWLTMTLAAIAPLTTLGAWWSGHRFYDAHVEMITAAGSEPAKFQKMIASHLAYGDVLVWLVPGLSIAVWTLGYLRHHTSAGKSSPHNAVKPIMIALTIVVVGLSAASTWYTIQTGHSGAEVVWRQDK